MQVTRIDLIEAPDSARGVVPAHVDVRMTLAEAAAIASIFGLLNGHAHVRLPGSDDIYDALTGGVFNAYFDDGVGEARLGLGMGHVDLCHINDPIVVVN